MGGTSAKRASPSTGTDDSLDMTGRGNIIEAKEGLGPGPKKGLFDDESNSSSDDDSDDGGAELLDKAPKIKINEEYARRFEHNKKREEKQRR